MKKTMPERAADKRAADKKTAESKRKKIAEKAGEKIAGKRSGGPERAGIPRLLLAGTNSGCGKTTLTCVLLALLKEEAHKEVQAFKCGPDYIDPMFHTRLTGRPSRNLDPFMLERETLRWLLLRGARGVDITVLEGVMGFYDGLGGRSVEGSTYQVARMTGTPVVLVVNGAGMSLSVVALIKGYLDFVSDHGIGGVILNRVSKGLYPVLKNLIEEQLPVKVYGYMPVMEECVLESRHLGLVTAEETRRLDEILARLIAQGRESLDLEGLQKLAAAAPCLEAVRPELLPAYGVPDLSPSGMVKLAVARDKAFCFYYQDNLELLEELGAKLIPFSPLSAGKLPDDIDGLYLGGGYPELFAAELARNTSMKESIRAALNKGLPCLAECGGFMYLSRSIVLLSGESYAMVGHLPGESHMTEGLKRFGYITLTARADSLLARRGEQIRGHEFHYSDADDCGAGFRAEKPVGGKGWDCYHLSPTLAAGYPHLHFWSNPRFAWNFVQACRHYRLAKDQTQDQTGESRGKHYREKKAENKKAGQS